MHLMPHRKWRVAHNQKNLVKKKACLQTQKEIAQLHKEKRDNAHILSLSFRERERERESKKERERERKKERKKERKRRDQETERAREREGRAREKKKNRDRDLLKSSLSFRSMRFSSSCRITYVRKKGVCVCVVYDGVYRVMYVSNSCIFLVPFLHETNLREREKERERA